MILAVIPARGGSKRFPGKNIIPFGGRPLLAWSVALAQCLPDVHCVVTTDDRGIAAAVREAGAEIVDRPAALAEDDTAMIDVMTHAAEAVAARNIEFDAIMLLQPTNPLRPRDMVETAIGRFRSEACDSLIAVSRRSLKFGTIADGLFVPHFSPLTQSRTVEPVFYENGLLYLTRTATLLEQRSIYGARALAFETERPFDEVDIDEPADLVIGEAILKAVSHRLGY